MVSDLEILFPEPRFGSLESSEWGTLEAEVREVTRTAVLALIDQEQYWFYWFCRFLAFLLVWREDPERCWDRLAHRPKDSRECPTTSIAESRRRLLLVHMFRLCGNAKNHGPSSQRADSMGYFSVMDSPYVTCQVQWRATWDWQRVVISVLRPWRLVEIRI